MRLSLFRGDRPVGFISDSFEIYGSFDNSTEEYLKDAISYATRKRTVPGRDGEIEPGDITPGEEYTDPATKQKMIDLHFYVEKFINLDPVRRGGWENSDLSKEWVPYQGPFGGEGWQRTSDGEIRYVEDAPGEVAEGFEDVEVEPARDGNPAQASWQSWDPEAAGPADSTDDEEDESAELDRDEITWRNVEVGDEIVWTDKYGDMRTGTVTADEKEGFDQIWAKPKDGNSKKPVTEDRFMGGVDSIDEPDIEVPESGATTEWMSDNIYYGQKLKIRNKESGRSFLANVVNMQTSSSTGTVAVEFEPEDDLGRFWISAEGVDWGNKDDNEKYELLGTESWDSLSESEKKNAIYENYATDVRVKSMDFGDRDRLEDLIENDVIESFDRLDVAKNAVQNWVYVEDDVPRSSVSGTGHVRMSLEEGVPYDTLHHEMGHLVASSFGFDFASYMDTRDDHDDEKFKRNPEKLAHNFNDIVNFKDNVPFEFGERTEWWKPSDYMFRDRTGDFGPQDLTVGRTYGDGDPTNPFAESITPTSVEQSDDNLWRVEVEEYRKPVYLNEDLDVVDREDGISGEFDIPPDPPGYDEWKDVVEEQVETGGEPKKIGKPNPDPETPEEAVENLTTAANRAWYKQAKHMEKNPDDFETNQYAIGSGYSAANAHETIAKTHEVIQTGNAFETLSLMDQHPYLVSAYTDVFDVPELVKDTITGHDHASEFGVDEL